MVTPGAALPETLRDTAISCQILAVPDAVFPGSTQERLICEQAYFDAGIGAAADGAEVAASCSANGMVLAMCRMPAPPVYLAANSCRVSRSYP